MRTLTREQQLIIAEIFRVAAASLLTGYSWYACVAIIGASRGCRGTIKAGALEVFADLYKPKDRPVGWSWWSCGEREPRVLALLLAAEILETNDLLP